MRLGLSFSWPSLNVEVNGFFYGAQEVLSETRFDRTTFQVNDNQLSGTLKSRGRIAEHGQPVTNLAIGLEKFLEPDFALLAGVQTDFSGLDPRQTRRPADTLFRQRKDAVHASLGVASYGRSGSLLLGLRGYYAAGEILMADASVTEPLFVALPQSDFGLSLVVSGQISFESVRDTALRATGPLLFNSDSGESR